MYLGFYEKWFLVSRVSSQSLDWLKRRPWRLRAYVLHLILSSELLVWDSPVSPVSLKPYTPEIACKFEEGPPFIPLLVERKKGYKRRYRSGFKMNVHLQHYQEGLLRVILNLVKGCLNPSLEVTYRNQIHVGIRDNLSVGPANNNKIKR